MKMRTRRTKIAHRFYSGVFGPKRVCIGQCYPIFKKSKK